MRSRPPSWQATAGTTTTSSFCCRSPDAGPWRECSADFADAKFGLRKYRGNGRGHSGGDVAAAIRVAIACGGGRCLTQACDQTRPVTTAIKETNRTADAVHNAVSAVSTQRPADDGALTAMASSSDSSAACVSINMFVQPPEDISPRRDATLFARLKSDPQPCQHRGAG